MNSLIKNILKAILILGGTGLILIIIIAVYIFYSTNRNKKRADNDYQLQCLICDSTQVISEKPTVYLPDLQINDSIIVFKQIRDNQVISSDTVYISHNYIEIPYSGFYKTDTILMITPNKLYYFLSGFHYKPYLGYGMFGYAGFKECRLSDDIKINGKKRSYIIYTNEGLPVDSIPTLFR